MTYTLTWRSILDNVMLRMTYLSTLLFFSHSNQRLEKKRKKGGTSSMSVKFSCKLWRILYLLQEKGRLDPQSYENRHESVFPNLEDSSFFFVTSFHRYSLWKYYIVPSPITYWYYGTTNRKKIRYQIHELREVCCQTIPFLLK